MAKTKKKATYRKRIYLGKDEAGKPQYRNVYGKTAKEAAELAVQLKLKLHKGIDISADRDVFEVWAKRWLATKERRISEMRYRKYQEFIKNKLADLRYVPISKIKGYDVQDIINDYARENPKTGKPTSEKTLKDILSVVRQIFDMAVKNRVIDFNPADAVEIPAQSSESVRRALTDEEQQWIVDTPHRAQRAAMIMMYAGLRRGELIPLTWGDINFEEKTISINKTVIMNEQGRPVIQHGKAKTTGSIRTVDIIQQLVDFLKKEKPPDAAEHDLVCPSAHGVLLSSSGWKRLWDSYLMDLNLKYGNIPEEYKSKHNPHGIPFMIPNITAHWLRHTFITMMYLSGVDVLTAMKQAGHSEIKTTLEIYTHLDKEYKRAKMSLMEEYVEKRRK